MTHDNPTPLADSGELRAELIAMHPVTIATQGERRGLLGDETVEALAQLFTQHHQALLQKIEEAIHEESYPHIDHETFENTVIDIISGGAIAVSKEAVHKTHEVIGAVTNILNQAREGKL